MKKSRREFIKAGSALSGLAAFGAGYAGVATQTLKGLTEGSSGAPLKHRIYGNAPEPESMVDASGQLQPNPKQRVCPSMCFGCWTKCGVRVRVDQDTDEIIRITGNPYHPLSMSQHIPFATPVREAMLSLSGLHEQGLTGRATACARGNAMLEQLDSPHRVQTPLKRVGPRGGGQWQPISFEQLIEEVVDGGDLFGEGPVEGLAAIRDLKTPLDPANPEYGPKANQLLVSAAGDEGRDAFVKRFTFNSYGTRNYGHHGAYCGFAFRAGSGALMNDLKRYAHVKPDWEHVRFGLFIGTSPAQAGNPFQRQARQLAEARSRGLEYVVVSPVLPNSSSLAAQPGNEWLPITPGTDAALAMAMIGWIIEQDRFDRSFLSQPGAKAAAAAGEAHWCNATHLVISEPGHNREGAFLRLSDLGLPFEGKRYGDKDQYAVQVADQLQGHNSPAAAELFVTRRVDTNNGPITVKSSLQRLKEEAQRYTLAQYSEICGISAEKISALAEKFTSYGKQAAVDTHGGMMSSNGFYTAYAVLMLNALVGNSNMKGGVSSTGGKFPAFGAGPRYNLKKFPGMVKPKGVFLSRSRFPYQKTSEYQRKLAAGENPYPSEQPWYPFSPPILSEHLSSALAGYPYRLKAWISHMSNPIYGQAGLRSLVQQKLKDPKQLPLFIAVDPFINETSAFADYIVPDSISYESWGWTGAWSGTLTKLATGRWPVVAPRLAKTAQGDPITLESFLIAVADRIQLPGFGEGAIPDPQGQLHPLQRAEDYYLRAGANVAYFKGKAVPDASDDDIELSGLSRIMPAIERSLKADEQRKVAYLYARGGRFEDADQAYKDDRLKHIWKRPLCIWNEKVGTSRNTFSGERYLGCPSYYPQRLADGTTFDDAYPSQQWPFRLSSYKSHLQSSCSIAADRLRQLQPENAVDLSAEDAQRLGIEQGERVRISTPGGSLEARVRIRQGVMPGALGIEHGFGHRELGARAHQIGDQWQPSRPELAAGINLNDLGMLDSSRKGHSTLLDWVVGSSARQALPARIERIG